MLPVFAESGSWGLVRLDGDEVSAVVENQALQRVQEGLKRLTLGRM